MPELLLAEACDPNEWPAAALFATVAICVMICVLYALRKGWKPWT